MTLLAYLEECQPNRKDFKSLNKSSKKSQSLVRFKNSHHNQKEKDAQSNLQFPNKKIIPQNL